MKIQQTKRMFGTIHTKNGDLYVKDYFANGTVVKLCLTNNPLEQKVFPGETLLIAENTSETSDVKGPNYGSLMFVRDILLNENMSYLGYKNIEVTISDFEDNPIETYELPEQDSNFNTMYGKRAEVVDTVENKTLSFVFHGSGYRNLQRELSELHGRLREKLKTIYALPSTCVPNKSGIHEFHKAICNCQHYLNNEWTYTNKISTKQAKYVAEFLGVQPYAVKDLSSLQAAEILDAYFHYKDNEKYVKSVKDHYIPLINYRPIDLLTEEYDFSDERDSWNSSGVTKK